MQSPHVSDDLPRLLTGDATRDEVMAAGEHLRDCPDCGQELVSAVVAHASLTSAQRFAHPVVAPDRDATAPEAPRRRPSPGPRAVEAPAAGTEPALPDLSGLFAAVREDARGAAAPQPAQPAQPAQRRRRGRLVAVGVAAAVVIGGGITIGVVESNTSAPPSGRSVALSPYDIGRQPAKLTISGSTMKIDASKLTKLDPAHVYEVWLTDTPRKNLAAIGTLGTDNEATLTVTPAVRSHYTHVEVSVQKTSNLQFSGVSVLRGDYG
ncbi:MAG TPA: anti-sigma factor [Jatrophihabitans sp.]|nr:anti-sigma factor [Jatrophihabitans sp.]